MDIYFNKFPLMYYIVDINGIPTTKIVRDITTNVRIRRQVLENIKLFDEYIMDNGDTPEIVAHKYYGSVLLQWVVMLCNQRYNVVTDFPMSQDSFYDYMENKYQSVKVPTFPSEEARNSYITSLEQDSDQPLITRPLYTGSSNDAVKWKARTSYTRGMLITNFGQYYITQNDGVSDDYCVIRNINDLDIKQWEPNTYYVQNMVLVFGNRYFVVLESGTSDISEGPDQLSGDAYNGTVFLRADVLFLEERTVIDIDTKYQWAIFPTDKAAVEFVDKYYLVFGKRIGASSVIHHLHHYEDAAGNVINYIDPEPTELVSPVVLVDVQQSQVNVQLWKRNTYYPFGTTLKISDNLYYNVIQSGESGDNIPDETEGEIVNGTMVVEYFPQYTIITNYMHEEKINEQKRHIKLIHKSILDQILDQLQNLTS